MNNALGFISDADLFVGKTYSVQKTFIDNDLDIFAKLSKDKNPLHFNEKLAVKTRFGGKIVHGMLTASLCSGVLAKLTRWCVYTKQEINFTAPVKIGDTITATGVISEIKGSGIIVVNLIAVNQKNVAVLNGKAEMKKLKEMYKK